LRHAAQPLSPPIAFELPLARLGKEFLRAGVGFALFLLLLAPAKLVGFDRLYAKPVLAAAQAIVVPTQHFPVLARMDNLSLHNLEFGVVLAVALFLVSTNLSLGARLKRFGIALAVLFAFHVLVAILTIKIVVTQDLLRTRNIQMLSTAEFQVVDWVKYFCYDLGLEIASFVLLLLTVAWNLTAGQPRRRRVPRRDPGEIRARRVRRLVAAGSVVGLAGAAFLSARVYGTIRERDPRHVDAHAKIGHLLWSTHKESQAAEQYRLAMSGGTTDAEVLFNLARVESRVGHRAEARRLLDRGITLAREPALKERFQKAIDIMQQPRAPRP